MTLDEYQRESVWSWMRSPSKEANQEMMKRNPMPSSWISQHSHVEPSEHLLKWVGYLVDVAGCLPEVLRMDKLSNMTLEQGHAACIWAIRIKDMKDDAKNGYSRFKRQNEEQLRNSNQLFSNDRARMLRVFPMPPKNDLPYEPWKPEGAFKDLSEKLLQSEHEAIWLNHCVWCQENDKPITTNSDQKKSLPS